MFDTDRYENLGWNSWVTLQNVRPLGNQTSPVINGSMSSIYMTSVKELHGHSTVGVETVTLWIRHQNNWKRGVSSTATGKQSFAWPGLGAFRRSIRTA